jgi:putative peptidoglycan lipid II flippase
MFKRHFFATVAGTSFYLIVFNVLGKGVGLVRESVFAAYFGLQQEFDLYLVGAVIPVVINTIILYIGQNYFIPAYSSLKEQFQIKFLNSTIIIFLVFSILISIILYLFTDAIMNIYLTNSSIEIRSVASSIFKIFLLTIPLNSLISVLSAYFQVKLKFYLPAISQLVFGITILLVVLFFNSYWNIYSIAAGFLAGSFFQLLILLLASRRDKIFSFVFRNYNFDFLRLFPKGLGIVIFIEIIGQLFLIVDRYFLNSVDPGGISALSYANNIYSLPISIISLTFATVIFPRFSEDYNAGLEKFSTNLGKSISINTYIFVPITFILYFFGDDIIKVLYYRGKFLADDVVMTFEILKILSLSLVFFSAFAIINKAMYSVGALKFLLSINLIVFAFKAFSSAFFVNYFQQEGLALSTSLSYVLITVMCSIYLYRKLKVFNKIWWNDLIISISNGAISVLIVIILFSFIELNYWISFFLKPGLTLIIYILNSMLITQKSYDEIQSPVKIFLLGK